MDKKEYSFSKADDCGPPPAPSAPPAIQGTEGPVFSHNQEPPPYQPRQAVPPKYVLDPEYVKAKIGKSPRLKFTVTSEPPLSPDTEHSLTHYDGKIATKRFKVLQDAIEFHDVRVSDTGFYTISCSNAVGLEGKATFELEVFQEKKSPAKSTTQNIAVVTHQATAAAPTVTKHESPVDVERLKKNMIIWSIVFTIVFLLGVFFLWSLPCLVAITVYVQLATNNMDASLYHKTRKNLRVVSYCFIAWLITSAIGTIIIVPTLAVTLS